MGKMIELDKDKGKTARSSIIIYVARQKQADQVLNSFNL
jgi:hypothetical protein